MKWWFLKNTIEHLKMEIITIKHLQILALNNPQGVDMQLNK